MQEEKLNKNADETPDNATNETTNTDNNLQEEAKEQVQDENPMEKLQAELNESKDKYLRLAAEFQNFKTRTQKERVELIKTAGVEVILSVLPVLDDFERAVKSMEKATEVAPVKEGVDLIFNKFKGVLESKGLKVMDCVGQPFDADLHDAITNIPAPSEELKGKVVEDIQKGYYLNDKVVRHAKVVVGQ